RDDRVRARSASGDRARARRARNGRLPEGRARGRREGARVTLIDRLLALQFTWRDAVDIAIVAIVLYGILTLLRGTRAMQISIGLVVLASTFFVARELDLPALEAISRQILFYLPFAIIVLFQQEIRRGLVRMGGNPLAAIF